MMWIAYIPAVFVLTFVIVWAPVQLTITTIALLAVLGGISLPYLRALRPLSHSAALSMVGVFISLLFLSAVWSSVPDRSLEKAAQVSLLVLGAGLTGLLLMENTRLSTRWLLKVFSVSVLLGSLFVLYEQSTGLGIEGTFRTLEFGEAFSALNQSASLLAIFLFYGALAFYRWGLESKASVFNLKVAVTLFVALVMFAASRPPADAVSLALIVAVIVFAISDRLPRIPALLPGVFFLAGGLLYPLIHSEILSDDVTGALLSDARASVLHRVVVWDFVSESIALEPWLGWGLDAARALPGNDQDALTWLRTIAPDASFTRAVQLDGFPVMPLHPHNTPLQVRLELGVPGTVVVSGLLFWLGFRMARTEDRGLRRVRIATFNAFILATMLSFSLWQTWILAAAILIVLVDWALCREMKPRRSLIDNASQKEGGDVETA